MQSAEVILSDPEVKELLMNLLDEESIDVVYALLDKEATDEEISEETGLRLNTVRRALYKLHEQRIASYVRTRDKEIGWYIYTWKLHLDKIKDILKRAKKKKLAELKNRLEFEQNNVFFRCPKDGTKVPFDEASEMQFQCPKCKGIMEYSDNQEEVLKLQKEIERLEKELANGSA